MVRNRVFELTLHTLYAHLAQAVHNAHAECAVTEKATGKMTGMMTGRVAGGAEGVVVLAGGVQHSVEDAFDEHL